MINLICIAPSVFEAASNDKNRERDLDYIWSLFYDSALLANLANGYWVEYVYSKKLSSSVRENFVMHMLKLIDLHRIIDISVESKRIPKNDDEWIRLANKAIDEKILDAVVMPEEKRIQMGLKNEKFVDFPIDHFGYQNIAIQPSRVRVLKRSKESLTASLRPIVRFAQTIRIIDPYFNCLKGKNAKYYYDALDLLANLIFENKVTDNFKHSSAQTIEIFASKEKSGLPNKKDTLRFLFEEKLLNISTACDVKIMLNVLDALPRPIQSNTGKDEMHDRFLLTDQFGFSLSQGFTLDAKDNEQSVFWHLLPEISWKAKMEECTISPYYPIRDRVFVEPLKKDGEL